MGSNEGITVGERRMARNNAFKSLAEDFGEATQPPNANTVLGAIQGTPSDGTSTVEGSPLHFLHQLLSESPKLEKEMVRLYQL